MAHMLAFYAASLKPFINPSIELKGESRKLDRQGEIEKYGEEVYDLKGISRYGTLLLQEHGRCTNGSLTICRRRCFVLGAKRV